MVSEERTWRTTHRAIVLKCAAERGVRTLVVPVEEETVGGGGWRLPCWTVEEPRRHEMDLGRVVALARKRLGMEVAVLRYVDPEEDEGTLTRSGTWVLEVRGDEEGTAPAAGRWMRREELAALGSGAAGDGSWKRALEVLREVEEAVSPPGRCSWSEPGWLTEAEGLCAGP